jgi:polysaccharide biosynthesis protein PslF
VRILFITGEYPAMQGGVGDYTRELGQALGALGEDVHILTHVDAGGDHLRAPGEANEPTVYPVMAGYGRQLWGHALRTYHDIHPDVVHIQYQAAAYGLHPAINFLPYRMRSLGGRPQVMTTFHDLKFPYLFPKAGPLRWQAVLALARGSDGVVVTNPADWTQLAEANLASRLHPIPIGSNIHCRPPADYHRPAQRARWGAMPADWLLCYFGFLNANKGGETLVHCLAELVHGGRPARLLMVGGKTGASDPTNAAYLARVEGLIAELGLSDRVVWTGFTEPEQVSANLLAADCAVLPYREGASLRHGSLMAALAHGLSIVTTCGATESREERRKRKKATAGPDSSGRHGPVAEALFPALEDGDSALLVPPDDPVQSAQAVIRLMTEPALREHLRHGALELSRQFEWEAIARRHLDAYQTRK